MSTLFFFKKKKKEKNIKLFYKLKWGNITWTLCMCLCAITIIFFCCKGRMAGTPFFVRWVSVSPRLMGYMSIATNFVP